MFFLVVSMVLGTALAFSASDDYVLTFKAPFGHEDLWYGITNSEIESTPAWMDLEDSPPMSASKAIKAARNAVHRFEEQGLLKELPNMLEWTLEELTLKPLGEKK